MFRKFLAGLVFGSGFALACIAIVVASAFLKVPFTDRQTNLSKPIPLLPQTAITVEQHFDELPVEAQVKRSSVILRTEFQAAPDGRMRAIVKEILKRGPSVELRFQVGDEYPSVSYYPDGNYNFGDGAIVFFVGSPAEMKQVWTYSGGRIAGLGGMPLELFRKKSSE